MAHKALLMAFMSFTSNFFPFPLVLVISKKQLCPVEKLKRSSGLCWFSWIRLSGF